MSAPVRGMPCQTKAEAVAQAKQLVSAWRMTVSGRAWVAGSAFPEAGDVAMAASIADLFVAMIGGQQGAAA